MFAVPRGLGPPGDHTWPDARLEADVTTYLSSQTLDMNSSSVGPGTKPFT